MYSHFKTAQLTTLQIDFYFPLFNCRFYQLITSDICRTEYFWCWILYSGNFGIQRQKLGKTITKLGAWEYILPIFFMIIISFFFVSSLCFSLHDLYRFLPFSSFLSYFLTIDQIIYSCHELNFGNVCSLTVIRYEEMTSRFFDFFNGASVFSCLSY